MRPVRLEIEGFTAFRALTTVDFDDADLFALTGPTGSGKTSVLDAIVFALYGSVPRLDKGKVAPVVSQGMAEARVRLDFTVGGELYTATRVVRRTKSGASTAEARLECAGEVVAGNSDEVTAAVGQRLGLSYDHFTKCVLLPQGQFARFLHDQPRDRQELLVSLLDLGIYGHVAELAGHRASTAKRDADVLEGRLGDLAAATPEAVAASAARVTRLSKLVDELDTAAPELDGLSAEWAEADAAAARLTSEASQLGSIAVPEGLEELHDRLAASTTRAMTVEHDVLAAEAANAAAAAALAALPDRATLMLARDAHDRRDALVERRTKGELVVAERTTDEAATAEVLATSERVLDEARADEVAAGVAHRAHTLRADLVAGEPCPVCLQDVQAVPDVAAPRGLDSAVKRRKKAEREQLSALEAHAAAQRASTVAATALSQVEADLALVVAELASVPTRDEVVASLESIDRAHGEREATGRTADAARRALREATRSREAIADEERVARHGYDTARDEVALLGPPARLGADVSLLDEWRSLVEWARSESRSRREAAAGQTAQASSIADRRAARLGELVDRCRDADVQVRDDADPRGAAQHALGQASAEHTRLVEQVDAAAKLVDELASVERRRDVARSLATHLDARHFEKWVLDEAMSELAQGATEVLDTLSSGQYALQVDKKGGFLVVDHLNAGETRSARTLSGGETFLASLALALALADRIAVLAARGAGRLESIFLDEGFGTLDADTLDVVASAVEELGASGRMVGVVSHVADLAERLPVRFEVERSGNASTIKRVDR